jgi:hypothetical protein
MRGTKSKSDYAKFVKAVEAYPPTRRDGKTAAQVFRESYALLDELVKKEGTNFPRACAWKAYALALSANEGWLLPDSAAEQGMSPQDKLSAAWKLADSAIKADDTDYDLYWAMADVCLFQGDFLNAKKAFADALYYNGDERHPSLFAEAASAMMQANDLDTAQLYFRKARTPDWHHWMKGIMLYIKAGRAIGHQETFLNLALDELKSTHAQLGDDHYPHEIQLIFAVVYWRKHELLSGKAGNIENAEMKALVQGYANRNKDAAKRAKDAFRAEFDHWQHPGQAATALPFEDAGDKSYWVDAVKAVWDL